MATREIICADAVKWLQDLEVIPGSVVTGIPDYTEIGMTLEDWKEWYMKVCSLIFQKLAENECVIFCQTDVKIHHKEKEYSEWVDKSYLTQRASEGSDCKLLFHKIISFNEDVGNKARQKKTCTYTETIPDVIYRGDQIWEKGSGYNSTLVAVKYCKQIGSKCIVDPFCGKGSILAVANSLGLNSIGVEIKAKLCRNAENLRIDETNEKNAFVWKEKKQDGEESTSANNK